ncbi:hypothetical protein WICPIJ_006349 [Wickerhamomyces pijperi]|uniref:Uncharacterized protein n=1 Tax=Wickerhamomyces pijperi TaxID=599730 RepID=A0A9P8TLH2_WICPI|nr:hypothetical protein WICPIJ_006349 [Wickerhamomyces pijperi]
MSLLLTVTLISLYSSLLFPFFKALIVSKLSNSTKLQQLKAEKYNSQQKLNTISAKDEYAKFIKLERAIKKLDDEIQREALKTNQFVAMIEKYLGYTTYISTAILYLVRFWYKKHVVQSYSNGRSLGIGSYLFLLGQLISGMKFIFEHITVKAKQPEKKVDEVKTK